MISRWMVFIAVGLIAAAVGLWGILNPGGWDLLSALNLFLGGFLLGNGLSLRLIFGPDSR
jgi:hypothetical protein